MDTDGNDGINNQRQLATNTWLFVSKNIWGYSNTITSSCPTTTKALPIAAKENPLIDCLPEEVMLNVFVKLDKYSLANVLRCCRKWNVLAKDEFLYIELHKSLYGTLTDEDKTLIITKFKSSYRAYFSYKIRKISTESFQPIHDYYSPIQLNRITFEKTQAIADRTISRGIKLVLVGDPAFDDPVGGSNCKTEFLITYINDGYPEEYIPTVVDNYTVRLVHNSDAYEVGLWDTAGQESYSRLRPLTYCNSDVIMLVASLVNPRSLNALREQWIPEVRHFLPRVPMLLVGVRGELRADEEIVKNLVSAGGRVITAKEGIDFAKSTGCFDYIECSAKLGINVKEAFNLAVLGVFLARDYNYNGEVIAKMREDKLNQCLIC